MTLILRLLLLLALVVVLAAVALVVAGQAGWLQGRMPDDLGVHNGRLKPPSRTDNSVSSQAGLHTDHPLHQAAAIAPLALRGSPEDTLRRLAQVIGAMPGAELVQQRPDYLYARFTTRLMRYVDDAEFWFDPQAGVVQVRSASRVGRRDFGVNRARIEAIRAALATAP